MKYVGSTSRDPEIRKAEWKREGRNVPKFKVVANKLTYKQAREKEKSYQKRGYKASAGGPKKKGKVYCVYTYGY